MSLARIMLIAYRLRSNTVIILDMLFSSSDIVADVLSGTRCLGGFAGIHVTGYRRGGLPTGP